MDEKKKKVYENQISNKDSKSLWNKSYIPLPVTYLWYRAASIPFAKFNPVKTSLTANPILEGGPLGSPEICINPDLAYMTKSKAGNYERGPESPYPDIEA